MNYYYSNDAYNDFWNSYANSVSSATKTYWFGLTWGLFVVALIIALIVLAWTVVYRWKLFQKAGKNGWEAIIPFYSSWTLYEISGFPGWLIFAGFISFIPFVKYVAPYAYIALSLVTAISICKKFNKTGGFWVLVWLLPIVGYPILAFGKDKYDPTKGEQKNIQPIKKNS